MSLDSDASQMLGMKQGPAFTERVDELEEGLESPGAQSGGRLRTEGGRCFGSPSGSLGVRLVPTLPTARPKPPKLPPLPPGFPCVLADLEGHLPGHFAACFLAVPEFLSFFL